MKNFYKNIINEKNKELNWKNSNCFYITTIIFIFAFIATFVWCRPIFNSLYDINEKWNLILIPFKHANWLHLFGNIECFLVVSLFLERSFGSFKYFFIVLLTIFLSPLAYFAFTDFGGQGESLVNFFLFGIFFIEILFNFKKYLMTKHRNIFTIVIIFLIFLLMSFTDSIQFSPFTTLLTVSHGSAFIEGLLVGIFSNLIIKK